MKEDASSGRVYCLVPNDIDEAAAASLKAHFEGPEPARVLRDRRRRERRGDARRVRELPLGARDERRRVRNDDGRRVDDRRRAQAAHTPLSLPEDIGPLRDRIAFVSPSAADDRRLEIAESLRLVVSFQLGDADAFRAIYDRHFDGVYGYLLTALRDRHDAEDGAQEVFIRTLRGLPGFEFRGSPFEAWLFRIARNHTLNLKRGAPPESPADPVSIDRWREARGEPVGDRLVADRDLLVLIERMPPSQRQVLVLRYMVGLDWADIADVLDRSSGAVRQLEQRALAFLRNRLRAVEQGSAPRTRFLPMRRRSLPSPVASSRRGALHPGIRAA